MTITVNQILVFLLICVLIVFVAEVAILAINALELIKNANALVDTGDKAVKGIKAKLYELGDKLTDTLVAVARDTGPTVKFVAGSGMLLTALGLGRTAIAGLIGGSTILSAIASWNERKKAEKEIKKSRKTIKKVNKQKKLEKKAYASAAKQSKRLAKKEAGIAKADARKARCDARQAARAEKKENKALRKAEKKAVKAAE
jgi:hypothetical protein